MSEFDAPTIKPSPATWLIVTLMVLSVVIGLAWSMWIIVDAWTACGGNIFSSTDLDVECQDSRSTTAWMPIVLLPLVSAVGLFVWRRRWRSRAPVDG